MLVLRTRHLATVVVSGAVLAACASIGGLTGIDTLGSDFVRAFSQDRNDAPLDPSELTLTLTPEKEPFDP